MMTKKRDYNSNWNNSSSKIINIRINRRRTNKINTTSNLNNSDKKDKKDKKDRKDKKLIMNNLNNDRKLTIEVINNFMKEILVRLIIHQ